MMAIHARSALLNSLAIGSVLALVGTADAALVGYWPLDDGSGVTLTNIAPGGADGTLIDGSGNNVFNSAWTTTSAPIVANNPYAYDFSGDNDDYGDLGNLGLTQGAVSMWVLAVDNNAPDTPDSINGVDGSRLYGQMSGAVAQGGAIGIFGNSQKFVDVWDGSTWRRLGSDVVSATQWRHLAFVADGLETTLWVDGVEKDTRNAGFDFDGPNFGLAGRFLNANGTAFNGLIDDVSIWSNLLSEAEISRLAAGESPLSVAAVAVPEPSSLALLALGSLVILPARRRSRT